MLKLLILFSLTILIKPHVINCNSNATNSITIYDLSVSLRNIVVFRNCYSYSECLKCGSNNLTCGICSLSEGDAKSHIINVKNNNSDILYVVFVDKLSKESYCTINMTNMTNSSGALIMLENSCQIDTCKYHTECNSCTKDFTCSYCKKIGCRTKKFTAPSNDESCSTTCCSLYESCDSCVSNSCSWCNLNRCASLNSSECITKDITCLTKANLTLDYVKIINSKFLINNVIHDFITGVAIGSTAPGLYPSNLNEISYDDWYQRIIHASDLGVDFIMVYTLLNPSFYEALSNFNDNPQNKLMYFMQIIWAEDPYNENKTGFDVFDQNYTETYISDLDLAIKALKGIITIGERKYKASGSYIYDVTKYLTGIILGSEFSPETVQKTNQNNQNNQKNHKISLNLSYISYTSDASEFEKWLATMLDQAVEFTKELGFQVPMSFLNWLPLDHLTHPLEPYTRYDSAVLDANHIISDPLIDLFASMNVFPNHPLFMNYEYDKCKSCSGIYDALAGYINELVLNLDIPLVVTEIGIPSSMYSARSGPNGRNQGGLTETEQGNQIITMLKILKSENVSGGIIFELYDEWFKTTWNIDQLDENSHLWRNRFSAEESFGLIEVKTIESIQSIQLSNTLKSFGSSNPILIGHTDAELIIVTQPGLFYTIEWSIVKYFEARSTIYSNGRFEHKILSSYNPFRYLFSYEKSISSISSPYTSFGLGLNPSLSEKEFYNCPEQFSYTNLTYLNGQTKNKLNYLEFRMPWNMLGIVDPSSKLAIQYPNYKIAVTPNASGVFKTVEIKNISFTLKGETFVYEWEKWNQINKSSYELRLKDSYQIIQRFLKYPLSSSLKCVDRLNPCKNLIKYECLKFSDMFSNQISNLTNITLFYPKGYTFSHYRHSLNQLMLLDNFNGSLMALSMMDQTFIHIRKYHYQGLIMMTINNAQILSFNQKMTDAIVHVISEPIVSIGIAIALDIVKYDTYNYLNNLSVSDKTWMLSSLMSYSYTVFLPTNLTSVMKLCSMRNCSKLLDNHIVYGVWHKSIIRSKMILANINNKSVQLKDLVFSNRSELMFYNGVIIFIDNIIQNENASDAYYSDSQTLRVDLFIIMMMIIMAILF